MNEYHIISSNGGQVVIYHCPFCGGRTPESRRASFFKHITSEESERLRQLYSSFSALPQVLAAWGNPDDNNPTGHSQTPRSAEGPLQTRYYRVLTYRGLSDLADVRVIVDLDNKVHFMLMPKTTERKPD